MKHELSNPEQWLDLYGDILYRYAIARIRDTGSAEDLVQETLLAALKARTNYAGKAAERTWLIGILKHKLVDYYRKMIREQSQAFDERSLGTEQDDFFDSQGQWQMNLSSCFKPDQALEQEQFLVVLQYCIDRLPPRMAQLYILRELEGMSSAEICELLSISTLNNCWVMLSRMRLQLRHCLQINWMNQ